MTPHPAEEAPHQRKERLHGRRREIEEELFGYASHLEQFAAKLKDAPHCLPAFTEADWNVLPDKEMLEALYEEYLRVDKEYRAILK